MGISVAASAQNSGHVLYWASQGRSGQTQARAQRYSLVDVNSLEALCQNCTLIISVCPPHAAEEVARQVVAHSFRGIYVDANAISPQRVRKIGQVMVEAGIAFVDGGIIGGPAWQPGTTRLYLSGQEAEQVARCFVTGPLAARVMGEQIGDASALKMCYAAYTKGTTALLCAILSVAEELGVRESLTRQWADEDPDFASQTTQRVRRVTAKAWRFAGEMEEIVATFAAAGMPGGFHQAAAEIYQRLAQFQGQSEMPDLAEVLAALAQSEVNA
jgi:3-hydroxyisobutyrate dehydrogenase-like beta-hydroxyacid dehydrogenase